MECWKQKLKDLSSVNTKIMYLIYYFYKNGYLSNEEKVRLKEFLLHENQEIMKSYFDFELDSALDNIRLSNFLSKLKILYNKERIIEAEREEKALNQSCLRTEMKNFKASRGSNMSKKMISNGALIKTDPNMSFQTASEIAVKSTKELKDKHILKSFIQNAYLLVENSKNII